MTSLRNNAPRRYFVDEVGQRVLIGLTHEETFEFERLDSQPGLAEGTGQAGHDANGLRAADSEARWLMLYAKHEGAWKAWMAQNRDDQSDSFNLY